MCWASFVILGRFQRLDYGTSNGRTSGDELHLETSGSGVLNSKVKLSLCSTN
jgi:hypothetical protein